MSRPRDLQIWWIVLFAGAFWVAIWQHEFVAKAWKMVSTAAVSMTSGMRGTQAPAETPQSGKIKGAPNQVVPKARE
jgi:hypothetical protein